MLVLVMSNVFAQAQTPPADAPAPDEKTEFARATEAAAAAKKAAEAYRITTGEGAGSALRLEPMPLLRWSNPVIGSFHGSVFVWTEKGRPAVVASIFKHYKPIPPTLEVEFHSLTESPATAERDGHTDWSPVRGGVELRPVPGAPPPADTPARRLRQLRAMALGFSATKKGRNAVTRPLRLLTQPVYRYEGNDPSGALFAFVEGTDPEVFLLLETRVRDKEPVWHYALARMNSVEFHVTHGGREIWSVPLIPWSQARDTREPYALITLPEGGNDLEIVPPKR
jgi:hypothetical protein